MSYQFLVRPDSILSARNADACLHSHLRCHRLKIVFSTTLSDHILSGARKGYATCRVMAAPGDHNIVHVEVFWWRRLIQMFRKLCIWCYIRFLVKVSGPAAQDEKWQGRCFVSEEGVAVLWQSMSTASPAQNFKKQKVLAQLMNFHEAPLRKASGSS